MLNLAKLKNNFSVHLAYGEIVAIAANDNNMFYVKSNSGLIIAKKTESCLLHPDIGDKVLFSTDGNLSYILSILEKKSPDKRLIDINSDLDIVAKNISLQSKQTTKITSPILNINCLKSKIFINKINIISKSILSQAKRIKTIALSVEEVVNRFTQRLINSFKFVKEDNEVQAKNSRMLIEENMTIQSKNSLYQSEEITTIQGEEVHLN